MNTHTLSRTTFTKQPDSPLRVTTTARIPSSTKRTSVPRENGKKQRKKRIWKTPRLCTAQAQLQQLYQKGSMTILSFIKIDDKNNQFINLITTVVAATNSAETNETQKNQKQQVTNMVIDQVSGKFLVHRHPIKGPNSKIQERKFQNYLG